MPTLDPDVEEASFAGAANAELGRDRGRWFTPGQVEEAILGYDASTVPGDTARAVLRRVAGIELGPGVWLTPNWWLRCAARPEGSLLQSRFASLLLQYKRPTMQYGASAPLMERYGAPYFRFAFTPKQHRTLVRLDEALLDEAVVRYASPCTCHRKQVEQWQMDRSVLENTNFVSPRRIGLKHRAWTYLLPGAVGYRNRFSSDDDAIPSDSDASLFAQLVDGARALALDRHVSQLLRLLAGEAADTAVDETIAELEVSEIDTPRAQAIATVARLLLVGVELQDSGVSWWLLEAR
jgi:hypothetical protein